MRDYDRWTRSRLSLAMFACGLALLAGSRAHAQIQDNADDKVKAKRLYEQGLTDYNLGHFTQALGSFENGYRIRRDPSFLFNIAQCERNLNQYEDAARTYRAYLRESPNVSDAHREKIQMLIDEMEKAIQAERAKQPPTGTQPPAGTAPAEPAGSAHPPAPSTSIIRSPERLGAPRRRWYRSPVGWTLMGVGVAALAVGGGLLGVAASSGSKSVAATTFGDAEQNHDQDLTYQQAGWPILGAGAASLVSAVIVFGVEVRK